MEPSAHLYPPKNWRFRCHFGLKLVQFYAGAFSWAMAKSK